MVMVVVMSSQRWWCLTKVRGKHQQEIVLFHKMCQCHNDDLWHRWWWSQAMCCMSGIVLLTKVELWLNFSFYFIIIGLLPPSSFFFVCILANFHHKKNVAWNEGEKKFIKFLHLVFNIYICIKEGSYQVYSQIWLNLRRD